MGRYDITDRVSDGLRFGRYDITDRVSDRLRLGRYDITDRLTDRSVEIYITTSISHMAVYDVLSCATGQIVCDKGDTIFHS